jgi:hypothetical protein
MKLNKNAQQGDLRSKLEQQVNKHVMQKERRAHRFRSSGGGEGGKASGKALLLGNLMEAPSQQFGETGGVRWKIAINLLRNNFGICRIKI